jgi:hypothetical protein
MSVPYKPHAAICARAPFALRRSAAYRDAKVRKVIGRKRKHKASDAS